MAKKVAQKGPANEQLDVIPAETKTKLRKLIIKNLGCIGETPVAIDLDDIVVLIGKNNTGKSTILRAYELVCSVKETLTEEDYPGRNTNVIPEIELHTMIVSDPPAMRWVDKSSGEPIVRERWRWEVPNKPARRQGFDVETNDWSEKVPWGAEAVANSRRPKHHRINAFDTPERQTESVVKLLLTALQAHFKTLPVEEDGENGERKPTVYGQLLSSLAGIQNSIVEQAKDQIEHAQEHLTTLIENVFSGYKIEFDAKAEEDLTSCLNPFKSGASLRMGPRDGHLSPAEKQGSGARRTLMWAALKYAAEKNAEAGNRTNLLLMDEPELCLHPNAVRDACNTLYNLPAAHNWQVMVTTHSPAFIDLSRDNTTVVRVDRNEQGHVITGTTVFRPETAKLSDDEREELKMLNLCDPSLCECLFGGKTVIVEGDTEYTAFKYILNKFPEDDRLKDVNLVRARGKSTICLVAKILNQFGARYAILHDSDKPNCIAEDQTGKLYSRANPAWKVNMNICNSVTDGLEAGRVRLVASIPNFEAAFFGKEVSSEKPVNAWKILKDDDAICERVRGLLRCLVDFNAPVPEQCEEWDNLEQLQQRVAALVAAAN